jgi:iron complex outermembrane recepter protein
MTASKTDASIVWTAGALAAMRFAFWPAVAQGATETDTGAPALDEIVVTSDRKDSYSADFSQVGSFRGARQLDVPLTINVIPDALIEAQQASGLLDALKNTAGVSPSQVSTTVYSNVAIRGIAVENRSNYLLDGILPTVNLIDLPLEDKDRVEVLKGASALYYGFTTPSGVVNLTMKRPTPERYVAVTLFGNQYGALDGHLDASDTWGPFGARLNAVIGSVDAGIDDTRGHRSLLAGSFDLKPNEQLLLSLDLEHILKVVNEPGIYQYMRLPAPTVTDLYPSLQLPPLINPTINFAPDWALNRAEETNVLTTVTWKLSPAWEISASYGSSHLERDRHATTIDLNTYGPNTDGEGQLSVRLQPGATFDNSNYRAELAGAFDLGFTRHQMLLGASQNIRDSFNASSSIATCPSPTPQTPPGKCVQNIFNPTPIPFTPFPPVTGTEARINDIGYYLFDRAEIARWLQLLGGVRKVDYTETNLSTHVVTYHANPLPVSYGVIVKPRPWMSVYGTYIDGLESTPIAPTTAVNAGAILPATDSRQHEVGIKLEPLPALMIQAAYFNVERGSAYVNGANVYVIDGRARFRGAEFTVAGELSPTWSVYASGQVLDAKQVSGAATSVTTDPSTGLVTVVPTVVGRTVDNAPSLTLSLTGEYRFSGPLSGLSANAGVYYMSDRAVNQFDQAYIPGYTLFDLGAAYRCGLLGSVTTFRLSAENVTDKWYFASTGSGFIAQGPPRMVKFSISTQF